jgi:uncharacterized protein YndB with AHSA1/START domain
METVIIILAIVVVAVGGLLAYAATKPDTFRLERSRAIEAPPEKIFALINDFWQWRGWSPWENIDPDLKRDYSGASSGRGAAYAWQGNNKVGQGRMEIVESVPPSKIVIKLDFLKPFEAHNAAEFTLTPAGDATNVNWAMHGPSPFISKVMCIFMSMDKMVGKSFEEGLANMKALAEK